MSIVEAIKGIATHISSQRSIQEKWIATRTYSTILAKEVVGILQMVPFAVGSYVLYHRLGSKNVGVSLSKDERYGPLSRNVVDVYRPPERPNERGLGQPAGSPQPVVLFVHGGVWATGSKWHYVKMASRLAEEGITTCVIEYTLYPDSRAGSMVGEVGQALDWVVENCVKRQDQKIVLVGHSAGAHLCAMLLVERLKDPDTSALVPDCFVGMAGVYDIARHFEYEKSRKVHHLSTMERAIGGTTNFADNSPALLLQRVVGKQELQRLPRVHLMASRSDITVPHIESVDMHRVLESRGCPSSTLKLYDDVGHGDFVVEWKLRGTKSPGVRGADIHAYTSNLPTYAQDLIEVIVQENK
jgi:acetyl esterase/lipase